MIISRELIDKFFEKRCTAEEAAQVSDYLKNNPAVLEEYLAEKEWDEASASTVMPEAFWEEAWKGIRGKKQRNNIVVWIRRTAVAASIAGMIGWGYYQFAGRNNANDVAAVNTVTARHRIVSNTTGQTMRFALQDSSVVELSPASVLEYEEPFGHKQRAIYLKGAATFDVAKDKDRPFTVYANNIATTALGTRFSVSTLVNSKVAVKLFEGKVVVRSTGEDINIKDIFLSPGEEFTVNKQSGQFAVQRFDSKPKPGSNMLKKAKSADKVVYALAFDRTSLTNVFDKISDHYHVNITYNKTEINNLQFTGSFLQTDSLNAVLSIICNMNGLSFEQGETGITITRIK